MERRKDIIRSQWNASFPINLTVVNIDIDLVVLGNCSPFLCFSLLTGNLQKLDLSYNWLEHLDQGMEILDPLDQTINIIEINNNKLQSLEHGLFQKCVRLRYLGLANNILTMEDLNALNTASGLTNLDISGNSIGELPYKMFDNLGLLESLNIRNASVDSIDPNAFVNLKNSLKALDLAQNNIQRIKREMFQPMENGVFSGVNLSVNQIVCDCGTKQFQDWWNEFQPVMDAATCTSPDGTVLDIKYDDLTVFCGDKVRKVHQCMSLLLIFNLNTKWQTNFNFSLYSNFMFLQVSPKVLKMSF